MRFSSLFVIFTLATCASSCEDILEVSDISEKNVEILAPLDGTTITDNTVGFTWVELNDVTRYHIQVATPNFNAAAQIAIDTVVIIDTSYTGSKIHKNLINGEYEWRIRALNSDYETPFSKSKFSVNGAGD